MITCQICVMDESCIPFTSYGESGCNHCIAAVARKANPANFESLSQLVANIQRLSKGEFDCVVGVSGGLDSSYVLIRAVQLGLRPIAVHMDNNWNSSMASLNLRRLLSVTGVPLVTVVTDWDTQRELNLAFLRSDVVDVELLYDNALHEVCFQVARQFGIKSIIGGANSATEGVEVPASWVWGKFDGRNVRLIARKFGARTRDYPIYTSRKWLADLYVRRISWYSILDYFPDYSRKEALRFLMQECEYVPYGNKHYENVFTRFYQGYILPEKFGIDKRKAHFSSEIVNGKMTRAEALEELEKPIYESPELLELDRRYVCTKLGMTETDLETYLGRARKEHREYGYDRLLYHVLPILMRFRSALLRLTRLFSDERHRKL